MTGTIKGLAPVVALVCAALACGATGCAERDSSQDTSQAPDTGLSPTSPNLVYAKDWTELSIDANSAKNSVDATGHYHTDKNMCQKPGDGVFDVAAWNTLATLLNQAVQNKPLDTPRCWDSPNGSKFYNRGIAELVFGSSGAGSASGTSPSTPSSAPSPSPTPTAAGTHRQIFEYKNGQICTTISDPALADSLMSQIENTLQLADRADAASQCPGYRPL